jgi:hypothetical protein
MATLGSLALTSKVSPEISAMLAVSATLPHGAVVARNDRVVHHERYLYMTPEGRPAWVDDPDTATAFETMREATRMASRLPAVAQAYGLPIEPEWTGRGVH